MSSNKKKELCRGDYIVHNSTNTYLFVLELIMTLCLSCFLLGVLFFSAIGRTARLPIAPNGVRAINTLQ